MKKVFAAIKRAPKRAASLAIVLAAVLVPAALLAWGPDRPTFTMAHPAPYVTFNSITDNPTHGDERNFVQIKEATASNSTYGENVNLQAGHDYEVYVYYHNNAASNLNDAAHDYKGIAKNAYMRVQMPATVEAGQKARVTAFVGASNANPTQVWDEAYGTATGNFALRYVPGSATIHSNGAVNGKTLPNNLYTTGTPLGYDSLNGTLPGCNQYAGYVTFKIHVDQPNFEVQKTVSLAGQNKYAEQVTAQPGNEVDYKIQYKNTGTTQQDNVVIKDMLPAGMTYVSGSTKVANSKTNGQWTSVSDNGVVAGGINIGSYAPNGNAYVKFTAKVVDNDKLANCGVNTLVNTAKAETPNGSKSDTANVVVSKTCAPKEIEVCRLSDKKIVTIKESEMDTTKYSTNFNDCKEIPAPHQIQVCRLSDKMIVTINESEFTSSKYSKNLNDCKVTPVVPKELPHTGATDGIAAALGAASLIAAAGYYVASRRALLG